MIVKLRNEFKDDDFDGWSPSTFLPLGYWDVLLEELLNRSPTMEEISALAALGAWSFTKGRYKFDQVVYEEIIRGGFSGVLPQEELEHLPDWCVYIDTPKFELYEGLRIHGFWVFLDEVIDSGTKVLNLILNSVLGPIQIFFDLDGSDMEISLRRTVEKCHDKVDLRSTDYSAWDEGDTRNLVSNAGKLMALVLFLCSEDRDIKERRGNELFPCFTANRRIKWAKSMSPARKIRKFIVGHELGEVLRSVKFTENSELGECNIVSVAPGHWYQADSETGRKSNYKWKPPKFNNSK